MTPDQENSSTNGRPLAWPQESEAHAFNTTLVTLMRDRGPLNMLYLPKGQRDQNGPTRGEDLSLEVFRIASTALFSVSVILRFMKFVCLSLCIPSFAFSRICHVVSNRRCFLFGGGEDGVGRGKVGGGGRRGVRLHLFLGPLMIKRLGQDGPSLSLSANVVSASRVVTLESICFDFVYYSQLLYTYLFISR